MATLAYLRVTKDTQDITHQRMAILEFARSGSPLITSSRSALRPRNRSRRGRWTRYWLAWYRVHAQLLALQVSKGPSLKSRGSTVQPCTISSGHVRCCHRPWPGLPVQPRTPSEGRAASAISRSRRFFFRA
jgi:hypothetical protein